MLDDVPHDYRESAREEISECEGWSNGKPFKELHSERKQLIKSLPSRLFKTGLPVVSQQYYRYVRGQNPRNKDDLDACLHIYEDGSATLAEA